MGGWVWPWLRIGMVTSSGIDDATPAAFYAHEKSRGSRYAITVALASSTFDYFAGAGAQGVKKATEGGQPFPYDIARTNGFTIVRGKEQLEALRPGIGKVWALAHMDDAKMGMTYEIERGPSEPSLVDFTRKGIELLENPRGFFLMVEGGKIDHACHLSSNDSWC